MRLHDEQRAKLRTPHEFKARPQTCNLEELYTPQELDLPDPTTGKKVQTVSIACGLISVKSLILGKPKEFLKINHNSKVFENPKNSLNFTNFTLGQTLAIFLLNLKCGTHDQTSKLVISIVFQINFESKQNDKTNSVIFLV